MVLSLAASVEASRLPCPEERQAIRSSAGVSLREFASALGVSPMTVLRWERGETSPRSRAVSIAYRNLLDQLSSLTA